MALQVRVTLSPGRAPSTLSTVTSGRAAKSDEFHNTELVDSLCRDGADRLSM